MDNAELMQCLLDLAQSAQLEVRIVAGAEGGEAPPASAVCRVRGELWVVLSKHDPADVQLRVLAEALRGHATELIQDSYLPPAVRALLEAD